MKKLILTLCLAATGTFAAVAQMRLTLDQALDLALSENPTVKVAEMEVQRYDYVKRQTWGGLLPQVSVTGQVNHSFIVQQMSKGFSLGNDPYTTLSGAVDASVPLFAPQVYRMMKMNDKQMATAVEAARLVERRDGARRIGAAVEGFVVDEHGLAVPRQHDVELDGPAGEPEFAQPATPNATVAASAAASSCPSSKAAALSRVVCWRWLPCWKACCCP